MKLEKPADCAANSDPHKDLRVWAHGGNAMEDEVRKQAVALLQEYDKLSEPITVGFEGFVQFLTQAGDKKRKMA